MKESPWPKYLLPEVHDWIHGHAQATDPEDKGKLDYQFTLSRCCLQSLRQACTIYHMIPSVIDMDMNKVFEASNNNFRGQRAFISSLEKGQEEIFCCLKVTGY